MVASFWLQRIEQQKSARWYAFFLKDICAQNNILFTRSLSLLSILDFIKIKIERDTTFFSLNLISKWYFNIWEHLNKNKIKWIISKLEIWSRI